MNFQLSLNVLMWQRFNECQNWHLKKDPAYTSPSILGT